MTNNFSSPEQNESPQSYSEGFRPAALPPQPQQASISSQPPQQPYKAYPQASEVPQSQLQPQNQQNPQHLRSSPAVPSKRKNSRTFVGVIFTVAVFMLIAGFSNNFFKTFNEAFKTVTNQQEPHLPALPPIPEVGDVPTYENTPSYEDTIPTPNYYENQWKQGTTWLTPPASETQTDNFNEKYVTAEEWLFSKGVKDMKVVFTDDPLFNCGASIHGVGNDRVAGCYSNEYGKTLFIWWGAKSNPEMRELILLHEYSHFIQSWTYYDTTISAWDSGQGLITDDPWFVLRETDATCRVYYEWKYTHLQYLDEYTASPCGATNWTPTWYTEQAEKLSITIQNW
jgi:hypothetical protein